jgi:hypothetical protein
MKKIILLLLTCACTGLSLAQSLGRQVERARIKMFRETVEFLAKDTQNFKQIKTTDCDKCELMDSIKAFIGINSLTRVDEVIDQLNNKYHDTTAGGWKNSLTNLKQEITESFFLKPGKTSRQDLPGYGEYQQRMEKIIQSVEPPAPAQPNSVAVKSKPKVSPPVSKPVPESESASMSYVFVLYALLAALATLCSLLFFQKQHQKKKFQSAKKEIRVLKDELTARKDGERIYRDKIIGLEEDLQFALQEKQTTEQLLEKLRKPVLAKETGKNEAPEVPTEIIPIKKYAIYADAGDGFSESYLMDKPNNETIFEITLLSPDTAIYVVSSDLNVQKYALSNTDYFLRRTCQYDSFPSGNSIIDTWQPGQLRKEGSKWVITSVAKVRF